MQRKALALISGGLDSMLAVKMMLAQDIHVEGINFFTGFCVEGHTHAIRRTKADKIKRNNALWVANTLGIQLHIIDVIEPYKDIVLNPKHGYGTHLNPCLDCKIFMLKRAEALRIERGFDFIITGEVIGQRPKSQKKGLMPIIQQASGAQDRLLRPLSAKLLPPTLPERQQWVDRALLGDISGRSRGPQIHLAKTYGFTDYAQPAGGCCFLTDKSYSEKLRDLWKSKGTRDYEFDDIMLLKVGRHIRPQPHFKLIIGREEGENQYLEGYKKQFISVQPVSHLGALTLVDGDTTDHDLSLIMDIASVYTKAKAGEPLELKVRYPDGTAHHHTHCAKDTDFIKQAWYV